MTKICVLHVLSTNSFGGAEKIAGQICRNLDRNRFTASILCNGGELLRKYRNDGLDAYGVNVNGCCPWHAAAFIGIIKKRGVDIVHAHGSRASIFALSCRTLAGRRYAIVSHLHGCRRWQRHEGILSAADRRLARRYSMTIACGSGVYERFMEGGGRPDASKVTIIANALEVGGGEAGGGSSFGERAAHGGFVYGFIGRFSKPKGLVPFLRKLIEHGDLLDGARLVLVGDGEDMKTLRRMADASPLRGRIAFEGYREDVLACARGFDVLVLPSIGEGLPMAILEAMSVGTPVLAFDVGSVAEVLRDGVNGYLVEAGDYDAFFGRMRMLKENREETVRLGNNAREMIVNEFGMDAYMARIEELYEGLARRAAR